MRGLAEDAGRVARRANAAELAGREGGAVGGIVFRAAGSDTDTQYRISDTGNRIEKSKYWKPDIGIETDVFTFRYPVSGMEASGIAFPVSKRPVSGIRFPVFSDWGDGERLDFAGG